jgi:hypothetical protein
MEPTAGTVINAYDAFHDKFLARWVALQHILGYRGVQKNKQLTGQKLRVCKSTSYAFMTNMWSLTVVVQMLEVQSKLPWCVPIL